MMKEPADITPLTLLDYPGKAACIFWFRGCNLRCPYCYNTHLFGSGGNTRKYFRDFLRERKGFLDAVVLSGGEASLSPGIEDMCREIRSMGYLVKLDTNGSNPERLELLLREKLVDYVALDHKTPAYGSPRLPDGRSLFSQFEKCLGLILHFCPSHEIRTTCHPDLLREEDILTMAHEIRDRGYMGIYYLQHYFHTDRMPGLEGGSSRRYDRAMLDSLSPLPLGYRNFPEEQYR